ncbi:MAG TPA: hypothetical protein PKB13_10895 [Clostridia bacterium]|nr:hypothetical protein [Clostridia bacterium]
MFEIDKNVITMTRGDTGRFSVVVYEPELDPITRKPVVYTPQEGDVITFTVKKHAGAPIMITKNGPDIVLNPSDTANLANGKYVYDVDITLANGDVNTIITESPFLLGVNV